MLFRTPQLPTLAESNAGRPDRMPAEDRHFVNGSSMTPPFPAESQEFLAGLGCFWGAERLFWEIPGVLVTAVGYAGGAMRNPTYEEVCTGRTGHAEVALVVHDPLIVSFEQLLTVFWEAHDPTQGMRQGNDVGTQYRSALYVRDEWQETLAQETRDRYQRRLRAAGYPNVTTEIAQDIEFFYAEDYHQQYLAKVPNGYCGIGGTGIACDSASASEAHLR